MKCKPRKNETNQKMPIVGNIFIQNIRAKENPKGATTQHNNEILLDAMQPQQSHEGQSSITQKTSMISSSSNLAHMAKKRVRLDSSARGNQLKLELKTHM